MTHTVRIRPDAEWDIEDAARWYESQQRGLGRAFLDSVSETLHLIQENPLAFPRVHRDSHRALIRRFPFGVHFVISEDAIVVIAVMHGSRDPRRWKTRT